MFYENFVIRFLTILVVAFFLYLIWHVLAPIYLYQIPEVYLQMPFWHFLGILWFTMLMRSFVFGMKSYDLFSRII